MVAVLAFAITLLIAVLLSGLAHRSVLSTAVLFLAAGFALGDGMLGWVPIEADHPVVAGFAELALFSVLFTEGMRLSRRDLVSAWRLPGRALVLGLPLTLGATAVLAHLVVGLPWPESFLLGAVLSPTDPVFAAAIVGRDEVPARLRHLLNVESGLNDGLALPVVVVLLAYLTPERLHLGPVLGEVALGVALGVAVPWLAIRLERSRFFSAVHLYQTLNVVAMALLIFAIASLTHANEFLAAFAGGITVASMSTELRDEFHQFGELVAELFKLAGLLVFGAVISPPFLAGVPAAGWIFAPLVLIVARAAALGIALAGTPLGWREWAAAAWFGPKGFASIFLGLLVLRAGLARGDEVFHLAALVIAASILLHSSTDVLVARWFRRTVPAADIALEPRAAGR